MASARLYNLDICSEPKKQEAPFKLASDKTLDISPWLSYVRWSESKWNMNISFQHLYSLESNKIAKFVGQILEAFAVIIFDMIRVHIKSTQEYFSTVSCFWLKTLANI